MLTFLASKASDRKARLFSCACCHVVWDRLCETGRVAVRIAEKYADGEIGDAEARQVQEAVQALLPGDGNASPYSPVVWALEPGTKASSYPPWYAAWLAVMNVVDLKVLPVETLANLLRDIVDNPFRLVRVNVDPSLLAWREGAIVNIAQTIYDEHAFDHLPILADALEDAGCTDPTILENLRISGHHVHGCWVLDLLLGKA
jgi:hypothetical protein